MKILVLSLVIFNSIFCMEPLPEGSKALVKESQSTLSVDEEAGLPENPFSMTRVLRPEVGPQIPLRDFSRIPLSEDPINARIGVSSESFRRRRCSRCCTYTWRTFCVVSIAWLSYLLIVNMESLNETGGKIADKLESVEKTGNILIQKSEDLTQKCDIAEQKCENVFEFLVQNGTQLLAENFGLDRSAAKIALTELWHQYFGR